MKKFLPLLLCMCLAGCETLNNTYSDIFNSSPVSKQSTTTQIKQQTPAQAKIEKQVTKQKPELTNCEKLLTQVRKENRIYMGDELLEVLSKLSRYCAPVDQDKFQDTTIGGYVEHVRDCEKLEPQDVSKKKTSFLDFCAKISPEPKKGKIFQYLANYDTYIKDKLNKELERNFPDDEEREIVLKQKLRKDKEGNESWGEWFNWFQTHTPMRINGYAVYGLIDVLGSFSGYAERAEKQFLASGKQLNCTDTSFPGIQYCGKVATGELYSYSLGYLGKQTVQNEVYVFKLKNQVVVQKDSRGDYAQVTSPNLRKAFLEQGLQWRDRRKYFGVRTKDISYGK